MILSASTHIRVRVGFHREDGEVWPWHKEGSLTINPSALSVEVSVTVRPETVEFRVVNMTITKGDRILSDGSVSSVPAVRQGGYWYRAYNEEGTKFLNSLKATAIFQAQSWWESATQVRETSTF